MAANQPVIALGGIEVLHHIHSFFQEVVVSHQSHVEEEQAGGVLNQSLTFQNIFYLDMRHIYHGCVLKEFD